MVADLGVALEDVARGKSDALDQAIALGTEIQKRDAALRKEFADVEAIIRAKSLPDEILQRHREIVTEYERRLAALAEGLRNVEQGTKLPDGGVRRASARTKLFFDGDPAREDAAADTLELIESYKPKRVQKSFTAEDLPFKRLVPISTPEIFGADAAWNPNPENGRAWLPSMQELASRTVDLLLAPASAQSSGTPDPEI